APIHLVSSGCQRTENFGFCASNSEWPPGTTVGAVAADVLWLYHRSRSAMSNSRLYAPGNFHAGLVTGIRTSWQVDQTSRYTFQAWKFDVQIASKRAVSESASVLRRSPRYSRPAAKETAPA